MALSTFSLVLVWFGFLVEISLSLTRLEGGILFLTPLVFFLCFLFLFCFVLFFFRSTRICVTVGVL